MRVAYEALAWGSKVKLFAQAWADVQAEVSAQGRDGARFPNGIATMWCYVTEDRARADAMLADVLAPLLNRPVEELRAILPIGPAEECDGVVGVRDQLRHRGGGRELRGAGHLGQEVDDHREAGRALQRVVELRELGHARLGEERADGVAIGLGRLQ